VPRTGTYYVQVSDAQRRGGADYGYRLRLSPPLPDYALRVTPSMVSAPRGGVVPLTVYALRQDGFAGEIRLSLKGAPTGMELQGGTIPAGATHARMTLVAPSKHPPSALSLRLEGVAKHAGKVLRRSAVPADNVMQAFLWRHLAPAQEFSVSITKRWSRVPQFAPLGTRVVTLSASRPASVRLQTRKPFKPKAGSRFFLRLDQPPPGVALDQDSVMLGTGEWRFDLVVDAAKGSVDYRGNLLIEVMREFTPMVKGKPAKTSRQESLGYLPAIPVRTRL
jgi:hypothetical protein